MKGLLTICLTLASAIAVAGAQDAPKYRGRKYKAPPPTSHIEVLVLKKGSKDPVVNAAVIFHSSKDGREEANLEVKTNEAGKAIIDVILTGSSVDVQVIAQGFATYAETYQVDNPTADLTIQMQRPRAQISEYADREGKVSDRPVGVQEPHHPTSTPVVQTPRPTNDGSDPDQRAPIDPGATPGNSQNPTPKNPDTPLEAPPARPPQ